MNQIITKSIQVTGLDHDARQEVDLDFLGSGYRRKVYVSTDPGLHWKSPPQRTRTSLTLIPIPLGGRAYGRLIYRDSDGHKQTVEMQLGHYYYLTPSVPFQIETQGVGALEVYAPKGSKGKWFDQEPLAGDYFDCDSEG